jgi:rhamnogalacturonyl hydrolase YesR
MRTFLIFLLSLVGQFLGSQEVTNRLDLDQRIGLTTQRLLGDSIQPVFTPAFVLADVDTALFGTRRFTDFSGDLSGRYIEVVTLLGPAARQQAGLDSLVARLLPFQHTDGRFGRTDLAYTVSDLNTDHMAQLWGNGRLLVGLMTYASRARDSSSIEAAIRLGDWFLEVLPAASDPRVSERLEGQGANGIICLTQWTEGLSLLYRATDQSKYAEAARKLAQVLPPRGQVHSHGYLSSLRGLLQLYRIDGRAEDLAIVREIVDELMLSEDFTAFGSVMEYFGGRGDRDEGCSHADMVRLLFSLGELTGESEYIRAANFALNNGLLYNQFATGDFGHHFITDGDFRPSAPMRAWWCCTMHGLRTLLEVKKLAAITTAGGVTTINSLTPVHYKFRGDELLLTYQEQRSDTLVYTARAVQWFDRRLHVANNGTGYTAMRIDGKEETEPRFPPFNQPFEILYVPEVRLLTPDGRQPVEPSDLAQKGILFYGPHVMGVRQSDFVAEPSGGNVIDWSTIRPGKEPWTLVARYRHDGYAGVHELTFHPIATQVHALHPFMQTVNRYVSTLGNQVN